MTQPKSAYNQGRQAYRRQHKRPNNPFPPHTDDYDAFERGWVQELKRSPDPGYSNPPLALFDQPGPEPRSHSRKKDVDQSLIERYRDKKG